MAKFRVTTYYTGSIDVDVIAENKEAAIELVRSDEREITQQGLRRDIDDIQESWTKHRTAWKLPQ